MINISQINCYAVLPRILIVDITCPMAGQVDLAVLIQGNLEFSVTISSASSLQTVFQCIRTLRTAQRHLGRRVLFHLEVERDEARW
jgi:hypothetical protein